MSRIKIYASGSGALSFVRVDHNNIACEPHKITMQEANQVIIEGGNPYSGFKLVDDYGSPLLIPDITHNRETDILSYDGTLFKKIAGNWYAGEAGGSEWHLLKNISMLAALKFYEENQSFYGM
jgi:hypothetical protein